MRSGILKVRLYTWILPGVERKKYQYLKTSKPPRQDLHRTLRTTLLLTAGGTWLLAIHMKAPISSLLTLIRFRFLPLHSSTSEIFVSLITVRQFLSTFLKSLSRLDPHTLSVFSPPGDGWPASKGWWSRSWWPPWWCPYSGLPCASQLKLALPPSVTVTSLRDFRMSGGTRTFTQPTCLFIGSVLIWQR